MKVILNMESMVGPKELTETRKQVATDSMDHTGLDGFRTLCGAV